MTLILVDIVNFMSSFIFQQSKGHSFVTWPSPNPFPQRFLFLQIIADQLHFIPIRRRIEKGIYYWSLNQVYPRNADSNHLRESQKRWQVFYLSRGQGYHDT
jgi:hypothetical protein